MHLTEIRTTVLLVESRTALRSGIKAVLSEAGFDVIEAVSSGEAWITLESNPQVQVMLSDLDTQTSEDGMELARQVHGRWPNLGLVITSRAIRHLRPQEV